MEFQHNGRRYIVSWKHLDGSKAPYAVDTLLLGLHELHEDEQRRLGVPRKVARTVNGKRVYYDGVTICQIKTLKDNASELPPAERWEVAVEGYAFKRSDELSFDKRAARRHSLAKAISGRLGEDAKGRKVHYQGIFSHATRTEIWNTFNSIWPPYHPEAKIWERRYAKVAQQLKDSILLNERLQREMEGLRRKAEIYFPPVPHGVVP